MKVYHHYWNPVDLMPYSFVNFVTFLVSTEGRCHICDIIVLNKLTSTQSRSIGAHAIPRTGLTSFFKLPKHEVDLAEVDWAVGLICCPRSWGYAAASQSSGTVWEIKPEHQLCCFWRLWKYLTRRLWREQTKICCDSYDYLMVSVYQMQFAGGVNIFFKLLQVPTWRWSCSGWFEELG